MRKKSVKVLEKRNKYKLNIILASLLTDKSYAIHLSVRMAKNIADKGNSWH